ncbi:MAG: aspartate kinase, partial [Planctomycetota bacterium]
AGVFVDLIVQNVASERGDNGSPGLTTIGFTVPLASVGAAKSVAEQAVAGGPDGQVTVDTSVAILSVSGVGVRSHTGVAERLFRALGAADVNVELIGTSEMEVSVVVAGDHAKTALSAAESAFADVAG